MPTYGLWGLTVAEFRALAGDQGPVGASARAALRQLGVAPDTDETPAIPVARTPRAAPPPALIDLLTDRHAVREAIDEALARESAPPGRPDGFDQGRIDEIKATMLATGPRRGGR